MTILYLASSLPLLELGRRPPKSKEEFRFSCSTLLSASQLNDLDLLLQGGSGLFLTTFGRSWDALQTQILNACVRKRAPNAKGGFRMHSGFSVQVERLVMEAFHQETPLEREWTLDKGRFSLLEDLIGPDHLGLGRVLAFAGQLRLVHRWAVFDRQAGSERFRDLVQEKVQSVFARNLRIRSG